MKCSKLGGAPAGQNQSEMEQACISTRLDIAQGVTNQYGAAQIELENPGGLKDQPWTRFPAGTSLFRRVRAHEDSIDAPACPVDRFYQTSIDGLSMRQCHTPTIDHRLVCNDHDFKWGFGDAGQRSQSLRVNGDI